MAGGISSAADLINAVKQSGVITKTAARTAVAAQPTSIFDVAGSPGAGTLAGVNTAAGVVPTDADAGYPTFVPSVAGAKTQVSRITFSNTVACRFSLYDRVFEAGAYAYNAAVTLANQPSILSRHPGGVVRNNEIWIEQVTAGTGTPIITITYTNQDGVAGRTTGAINLGAAFIVGRMFQMPLAPGDQGVQKIESVTATGATAGTFNVNILRPLYGDGMRVNMANDGNTFDFIRTQLVETTTDAALFVIVMPDGTSTGAPSMTVTLASI